MIFFLINVRRLLLFIVVAIFLSSCFSQHRLQTLSERFLLRDPSNITITVMQSAPEPKSALGRYRLLAPSAALKVSPLALGTMNFGDAWYVLLHTTTPNPKVTSHPAES